MTHKDKLQLNLRGYKLLNRLVPRLIETAVFQGIFSQALPYVNLFMSASIINAIVMQKPLVHLLMLAAITAALNLVIGMIDAALRRRAEHLNVKLYQMLDVPVKDKVQQMDYELLDDASVYEDFLQLKALQLTQERGILRLHVRLNSLINGIANSLFSVGLVATAFTMSYASEPGVWKFLYSPFAVLVLLVLFFANIFLSFKLKQQSERYSMSELGKMAIGNRQFMYFLDFLNRYTGAKDVKLYGYSDAIISYLTQFNRYVHGLLHNTFQYQMKTNMIGHTVRIGTQAVFYIYITLKALFGSFGVGNIVQYAGALMKLITGVNELAFAVADLNANCEVLQQYFAFLDTPNKKYQGKLAVEKIYFCDDGVNDYRIELKNVSFKYPNSDRYILKNINLTIENGVKLAVVGMNGSGKTTMIKLLTRLYDPTEGEITLNGIDIRKYDYSEYMRMFGVVFQDFKIFAFTLGQNVACSVSYDEAQVVDVLQRVGLAGRLQTMQNGVHTCLYKEFEENGVEISGGEAQKVALARALYRGSPFIILDEPTAALDPIAEFEIYSKFNALVGNKTTVYISHRLSSCKFCDRIAVFHQGEIVQVGTHGDLVAEQNGKYYELWQAQAQYYDISE